MGENSKIEWTDHTFNPWLGCAKVSQACTHCYAESWAKRTGQSDLWRGARKRTRPANWAKPLKWNAEAEASGARARVFCASLADVFEDREDLMPWREDLWALLRCTPWLDWLLLTKRPENIRAMLPPDWGRGYPNVWLGTTVESAEHLDRMAALCRVPAAVRFLSCEPLLGPLVLGLRQCSSCQGTGEQAHDDCPECDGVGSWIEDPGHDDQSLPLSLHWVIVGGESGGGARPMSADWARTLRDECAAAGVPMLFKQWGEWDATGARVGKAAAGRLLDGIDHKAFPRYYRTLARDAGFWVWKALIWGDPWLTCRR